MAMGSDIVFTSPLGGNGNGNGFFGGEGVGAFAGAALGSLLFNGGWGGWGGNGGWNRGGWGGGYGGNTATGPIVITADSDHSRCSSAELDALSNIQTSINGLGLAVVQGQNSSNLAACQGFSGVVASNDRNTAQLQNSMNQGFAGLNTVIQGGDFGIQQTLCQGFGGLNTAILSSSKDAALQSCQSTGAITSVIESCCCKTQNAIHAEGEATRQLISKYAYEELQTKLCDSKAENAALKSQAYVAASQAAQSAEIRQAIDRQSLQFGAILGAYRTGRIDERDSTATPAAAA